MRPKLLRMRLRPVNDLVIAFMRVCCLVSCARLMVRRSNAPGRESFRQPDGPPERDTRAETRGFPPVQADPAPVAAAATASAADRLLDLDSGALIFQQLLDLRGLVLVHGFLHGLRRAFDQILGLLQIPVSRANTDAYG